MKYLNSFLDMQRSMPAFKGMHKAVPYMADFSVLESQMKNGLATDFEFNNVVLPVEHMYIENTSATPFLSLFRDIGVTPFHLLGIYLSEQENPLEPKLAFAIQHPDGVHQIFGSTTLDLSSLQNASDAFSGSGLIRTMGGKLNMNTKGRDTDTKMKMAIALMAMSLMVSFQKKMETAEVTTKLDYTGSNGKRQRGNRTVKVLNLGEKTQRPRVNGTASAIWTMRFEVAGHWRKLEPGKMGKNRAGEYVQPDMTWVVSHIRGDEALPLAARKVTQIKFQV